MTINRQLKTPTLGGKVFWTDKHEYQGWRIQYNPTLDTITPLKPYRLLNPKDRLIASADSVEELVGVLPDFIAESQTELVNQYKEDSFFKKIGQVVGAIGRSALVHLFTLYHLLLDENTPTSVKMQIMGVLAYFILPIDLIPDVLVPIGYSDDMALVMNLIATIPGYITPEITQRAEQSVIDLLDK